MLKPPSVWGTRKLYRQKPAFEPPGLNSKTGETEIELTLDLNGSGQSTIATGVGFFDHMLTLLARHSLIDLTVEAKGDLHVDAHHTVEDVGICFGKALTQALASKAGIRRYGSATLPMDETLATAAVDLSGRPFCVWNADVPLETLGNFSSTLAEEFWRAVSSSGAFITCALSSITVATHTISLKRSSRRRPAHCAKPWNWTRVRLACLPRRGFYKSCEPAALSKGERSPCLALRACGRPRSASAAARQTIANSTNHVP